MAPEIYLSLMKYLYNFYTYTQSIFKYYIKIVNLFNMLKKDLIKLIFVKEMFLALACFYYNYVVFLKMKL